jgi:uncharacterized protein
LNEQLKLSVKEGRLYLSVRLQPRASRNRILGVQEGALKVSVTAPPVDDRANRQAIDFLAGILQVPRQSISVSRGERSRNKIILIEGLTAADCYERLHPYLV